ncbi:hypothetical protein N7517_004669 [Penicillium concentricum]|uniref:Uncharacterized protein n=1 Tax=Penicillium concentricum TaxID=293559 RepID=A0A9W9S5Y5_9EURO|nr:uncharacterized protein N7517_004669 [Penicillium concentricum]KAJ5372663.1 hypothetical protein N7517_004669 [Penicillium concentricum]
METPWKIEEVLVVTSSTPHTHTTSVTMKKVTPSSELSSPNKSCILSPDAVFSSGKTVLYLDNSPLFAPSKYLLPLGEGTIDKRSRLKTTHGHPELPESPELSLTIPIPPSRHIILPFNLRHDGSFNQNSELLSLSFDGFFLRFWLSTLPPKPWPLTIAGVQPYFTTDPIDDGSMPPIKRMSKSHLRISANTNVTNLPPSEVENAFKLVFEFFTKTQIVITQVQYWGRFFIIVLEYESTDLSRVPRTIGCCNCFYLFENEVGRPRFPARRITDPTGNVIDDSKYDTLRPGIMLSSGTSSITSYEYRTTSGALVEDSNSEQYMTVASHSFLDGDRVFHPCASGEEISQPITAIAGTGIAIAKLHDDIPFTNETFETPVEGIGPTQLQGLVSADNLHIGPSVYMNSPFVGYCEGTCGPWDRKRVPIGDPSQPQFEWVKTRWCYMGQVSLERLRDGVCGSAIWDDDGNVIGFFRYAPTSGHFLD